MNWNAYVDEAMRNRAGLPGHYVLAAALVDDSFQPRLVDRLREQLESRQPRLHWRTESAAKRRKLVDVVAELDLLHIVVVATPADRRRQERARVKCIQRLLHELCHVDVRRAVFESRGPHLDARDLRTLQQLRDRSAVPAFFRIDHERSVAEPSLWLADIVAGAVRAHFDGEPAHLCPYHSWCRAACH